MFPPFSVNIAMSNATLTSVISINDSETDQSIEWDLSLEVYDITYLLCFKIFGLLLTVFGMFGNICTICVLVPKPNKRSVTIFLIGLALSDFLSLLFSFIFCIYRTLRDILDPIELTNFLRIHYYYINYVMRVPKNVTNCLTVSVAFERLIAVLKPHGSKLNLSKKSAIRLVVVLFVVVTFVLLPFALEFTYKYVYNNTLQRNIVHTAFTSFGSDREFFFVYYIVTFVCLTTFAIVLSLVCNLVLMCFLLNRSKMKLANGSSTNNANSKESKTTKPLLIITFIFIICITPAAIYYPLRAMDIYKRRSYFMRVLFAWVNLFEMFNHFANPVVLYINSTAFRKDYIRLFCKNKISPSEPVSQFGQSTQMTK